MKSFFYSKFDNVNWGWWKPENIKADIKPVLERINNQLKSYLPANILIYYYNNTGYILISNRFQIGRDNAGRSFGFLNFLVAENNEIRNTADWLELFENFTNPGDYHFPEKTGTPFPVSHPADNNKELNLFEPLFEHCLTGDRFCIKDDEVSANSRLTNEQISAINFNSFPGSASLFRALALLPFSIARQVSFCLNYEDDFISSKDNRLDFIDIIYCGDKTIVTETFHLEEKINFNGVAANGFAVYDLAVAPQTLKWAPLFRYLADSDKEDISRLNNIFETYCRQLHNPTRQELTAIFLNLYRIMAPGEHAEIKIDIVQRLMDNPDLADHYKKDLLKAYLNKIDFNYTLSNLDTLNRFCRMLDMEAALNNNFSMPVGKPVLVSIINGAMFEQLSGSIKDTLTNQITSEVLKLGDLSDNEYFSAYQKGIKATRKQPNYDYLWRELDSSDIDFSAPGKFKIVERVYELTGDKEKYRGFLEKQYSKTGHEFWRNEIVRNNFRIKPQLSINILRIDDCLQICNAIIDQPESLYHEDDVNNLLDAIVAFVSSYGNLANLATFHYTITNDSGYLRVSKKLTSAAEKRIEELVYDALNMEVERFNKVAGDISESREASRSLARLFLQKSILRVERIESKKQVRRALYLLKSIRVRSIAKLEWLSAVLVKLNPQNTITKDGRPDDEEKKFRDFVRGVKGWSSINHPYIIALNNESPFSVIRSFITERKILVALGLILLIVTAWVGYIIFKPDDTPAPKNNVPYVAPKPVVKKIDSNKVIIDEAEQYLNQKFFSGAHDTLTFSQFKKKRQGIDFLKFSFTKSDFSKYKIASIDTIKGYREWNLFVKKYKDSLVKGIKLQTVHTAHDSISRVYHIKILSGKR